MSQDRQLQQAVLEELALEPSVTAAHIGVSAQSGIVTLTGHVESFAEKHAAELVVLRDLQTAANRFSQVIQRLTVWIR